MKVTTVDQVCVALRETANEKHYHLLAVWMN